MAVNALFDKSFYLTSKLTQLRKVEPHNALWKKSDADAIKEIEKAIAAANLTLEQHYVLFGADEGLSPNKLFNAEQYLAAKAQQLNATVEGGRTNWTASDVTVALKQANLTAFEHFQMYGWKEGVNPSNQFDVNAYLNDKLTQLQSQSPEEDWTMRRLKKAFEDAGLDPIAHLDMFGKSEGLAASGAAFTVSVNANGVLNFGGTAAGDITFTVSEAGVATFERGGAIALTKLNVADFSSAGNQNIKLAANVEGLTASTASKLLSITGFDANGKTYSITDSLVNLKAANPAVVNGAAQYTLTDMSFTAGAVNGATVEGLSSAQEAAVQAVRSSDLVAGATNSATITVNNGAYTLADTLANLTAAADVRAGATSYTLSDSALTAAEVKDSTIAGLSAAQASAQAAVRGDAVVAGATNGATIAINNGAYTLQDTKANLASNILTTAGAASYALSDTSLTAAAVNGSTIAGLEAAKLAAVAALRADPIVAGATNGATITISNNSAYTLHDTLLNLKANTAAREAATSYSLSEAKAGPVTNASIGDLANKQALAEAVVRADAVFKGATNAGIVAISDGDYTLLDTLANLTASEAVRKAASSYTLSDTALTANAVNSTVNGLAAAQAAAVAALRANEIVNGATNANDITITQGTYTLKDTLENLTKAAEVRKGAASYELSDTSLTAANVNSVSVANLGAAQLAAANAIRANEVVAGASNGASITVTNGDYSLFDTLENLKKYEDVRKAAEYYTLFDTSLKAQAVDSTVDGLEAARAAAVAALRADPVIHGATNGKDVTITHGTYTLKDTLAKLTEAAEVREGAASYTISDTSLQAADIYSVSVAGLGAAQLAAANAVRANEVVAGASNSASIIVVNGAYSIKDTLENLKKPEAAPVLQTAKFYELSDTALVAGDITDSTVDGLKAAQAAAVAALRADSVIHGALNGKDVTITNGAYSLKDSLAKLTEAAEVRKGAASYELTDTSLTAAAIDYVSVTGLADAQNAAANAVRADEVVAGASNSASIIVVNGAYSLLDTLENLKKPEAASVVKAAEQYFLSDTVLVAGDITDSTVEDLEAAQEAAVAALRADPVVLGAKNGGIITINNGAYTLKDSLANLTAAAEVRKGATSYTLTDTELQAEFIPLTTVAKLSEDQDIARQKVRDNEVVKGATNGNDITIHPSKYFLADSLANLINAQHLLNLPPSTEEKVSYYVNDYSAVPVVDSSIADLNTKLQAAIDFTQNHAVVKGAINSGLIKVVAPSYTLKDSWANVKAALKEDSITKADSVTVVGTVTLDVAQYVDLPNNIVFESYDLHDTVANLTAIGTRSISDGAANVVATNAATIAEAAILEALAGNATYSISDVWAKVQPALGTAAITGATTVNVTDNAAMTVAGYKALPDNIVLTVGYSLSDTAANILGEVTIANGAVNFVVSGTVDFDQAEALIALTNTGSVTYTLSDIWEHIDDKLESEAINGSSTTTVLNIIVETPATLDVATFEDLPSNVEFEAGYSIADFAAHINAANAAVLNDATSITLENSADANNIDLSDNPGGPVTANITIDLGAGNDTFVGGDGDDVITGGVDIDNLSGGAGDDTFIVASATDGGVGETYNGGDGNDTLRITGTAVLNLSDDTLVSIETLDLTAAGVQDVTLSIEQVLGFENILKTNDVVRMRSQQTDLDLLHVSDTQANISALTVEQLEDLADKGVNTLKNSLGDTLELTLPQALFLAKAGIGFENDIVTVSATGEEIAELTPEQISQLSDAGMSSLRLDGAPADNRLTVAQLQAFTEAGITLDTTSYVLADTLANLLAAPLPAGVAYELTDVVGGITALNPAQATVLEGATNASGYEYALNIALADVATTDMAAYPNATGYALTDVVGDITALTAAQATALEAAENAGDYAYVLNIALAEADDLATDFPNATGYALTDDAQTITALTPAQAALLEAAENAGDYAYDLSIALADVATTDMTAYPNANGYALTDDAQTITALTPAQAALLEGAENAGDYAYDLSIALADVAATTAVMADDYPNATGYVLSDAAETITALTPAQAALLEGAENAGDYAYDLSIALADVATTDMNDYPNATGYELLINDTLQFTAADDIDPAIDNIIGYYADADGPSNTDVDSDGEWTFNLQSNVLTYFDGDVAVEVTLTGVGTISADGSDTFTITFPV